MDKLKFGQFIYERRIEAGLTQEELGYKLGVTNKAVSKWETGETLPDVTLVESLAKALNITTDELFAQEIAKKKHNKKIIGLSLALVALGITAITLSSIMINNKVKAQEAYDELATIEITKDNLEDYFMLTPLSEISIDGFNITFTSILSLKENTGYKLSEEVESKVTYKYTLDCGILYNDSTTGTYSLVGEEKEYVLKDSLELNYSLTLTGIDETNFKSFTNFYCESIYTSVSGQLVRVE